MKQKFKNTVGARDMEGTRISLANEMMLDPRGESFKEMRAYAEMAFPNLYEPHNGELLDKNQDNWNEALLFSTKNALDDNFSKERLDYYFNLAKVVLKDKADTLERERSMPAKSRYKESSDNVARNNTNYKPLYVGLTIGGLIVGGAGLIMGKTIAATIGIAGAVVGGSLMYNKNRK